MAGQTSYPTLMVNGSEGLLADSGFKNVLSPSAYDQIPVGSGVAKVFGVDYQARLPEQNLATLVFSADLVASNVINGNINGVAIAPVTYASSHLATMTAIAAAIETADDDVTATVGGANNRTITIMASGAAKALVAGWVVTLGGSQATITMTNTTYDTLYGIALRTQDKMNLLGVNGSAGAAPYYAGTCVSMLTRGRVFVLVEDTLNSDDAVYMRFAPNGGNTRLGTFRSDSDSGTCLLVSNAVWRVGATAGNLAVLEINLPS